MCDEQADPEAAAHHIFDVCIKLHEHGLCHLAVYHKNFKRGNLLDTAMTALRSALLLKWWSNVGYVYYLCFMPCTAQIACVGILIFKTNASSYPIYLSPLTSPS
jgi:hypothetical protein